MSENTLLMAMILGQSLLIVVVLGVIGYFSWQFHRNNLKNIYRDQPEEKKKSSPSIESTTTNDTLSVGMCDTHPNNRANGSCGICEKLLCEDCNMEIDRFHFCPEHFQLFTSNEWTMLEKIKTTPETTEASAHLFEFKRSKWKKDKTPMYIEIHYQINVETDQIESDVALYAIKNQSQKLKEELKASA